MPPVAVAVGVTLGRVPVIVGVGVNVGGVPVIVGVTVGVVLVGVAVGVNVGRVPVVVGVTVGVVLVGVTVGVVLVGVSVGVVLVGVSVGVVLVGVSVGVVLVGVSVGAVLVGVTDGVPLVGVSVGVGVGVSVGKVPVTVGVGVSVAVGVGVAVTMLPGVTANVAGTSSAVSSLACVRSNTSVNGPSGAPWGTWNVQVASSPSGRRGIGKGVGFTTGGKLKRMRPPIGAGSSSTIGTLTANWPGSRSPFGTQSSIWQSPLASTTAAGVHPGYPSQHWKSLPHAVAVSTHSPSNVS